MNRLKIFFCFVFFLNLNLIYIYCDSLEEDYNFKIDEIKFFNKALTDDEVLKLVYGNFFYEKINITRSNLTPTNLEIDAYFDFIPKDTTLNLSLYYSKKDLDSIVFVELEPKNETSYNSLPPLLQTSYNFPIKKNSVNMITLEGNYFFNEHKLLNLPDDFTQSVTYVEPTKAIIKVEYLGNSDFSDFNVSFSNHEYWKDGKTITLSYEKEPQFISTWDTTNITSGSSNSNQITLPLESSGNYNFVVDWGDGTTDTITQYNQAEITHTYLNEGVYEIKINGTITGFRFNNLGDRNKLLDISNYGSLNLGNNGGYFYGAENLQISATDTLDLSGTNRFSDVFRGAKSFNSNIENWDTSQVQLMNGAFLDAQSFNQPLNAWNTSSLWFIRDIFRGATSFNQDLDNWDVSRVTDFALIFFGAHNFNGDISTWDTSKATSFYQTFRDAYKFNSSINDWDTSNVETMFYMFRLAKSFDQPLDKWDTSSVVDMAYVFEGAHNFSQDLGSWDTSSVTNMGGMFIDARVNFDASNWDTSSVTNMAHMFKGVSEFNQDLESWDTSSVTNMAGMFAYTSFNGNITTWDTSKVTDFGGMFHAAGIFNQDLSNWDISSVVNCVGFDAWTPQWLDEHKPNFDSSCFQYG